MAEAINGNGQKAAENAIFAMLGKYAVPVLCSAAMLLAAAVGGRVLSQLDRQSEVLSQVQTDVAVMKNDIGYLKERGRP
jgi:hypothetical protein